MRRNKRDVRRSAHGHESDFHRNSEAAETLDFSAVALGQRKPQSCPTHCPHPDEPQWPLGGAMDIEDVAQLLGCSVWTVRQKYLPQGLPYLRASVAGKFIFFREQVLEWILQRQGKEERK